MTVSATITGQQPITATISGGTVAASVPSQAVVGATVSGGVGPQGIQGPAGPAGSNTLANLTDVQIDAAANGDVLRYENGKWRDFPDQELVIDGQNF